MFFEGLNKIMRVSPWKKHLKSQIQKEDIAYLPLNFLHI
jgi:hypothetical protein